MAEPGAAKMLYLQQRERQAAQWVFENRKRAGTGMDQYPDAHCLYLAIRNEDMVYGGLRKISLSSRHLLSLINDVLDMP